ncbi:hypothetical protein EJB05_41886 [Eragrostis curvula]|uniref:Neprosin PEP catalytic domain-containing protein n=1 Tax=Eragrostis curvula TaxID=38414 RepID=A0A5J9TCY8_9POAL|nr:hypothetical protein EJB05_41886 [Eragrostis curvula]
MLQDMCLALLILVLLTNHEATSSVFQVHSNMRVSSLNMTALSFMDIDPIIRESDDESKFIQYYAEYRVDAQPAGGYTGGMATLDVYNISSVKRREGTAAVIWVSAGNTGQSDFNDIQAGWMVDPGRYGDNKAHFFVYCTTDGYRSVGCFNLDCTGFVPVNGAPITPEDTLEPAHGQAKISLKIFKNKEDGDWWLHFGYDVNNLSPVGFWPKNLFTNLEDHAEFITWGGTTKCPRENASPPMGNGQWPGKNSASFQNVQLVDTNGQGYAPPVWTLNVYANNKKCYQASTFLDDMFYYGGPGGCVN